MRWRMELHWDQNAQINSPLLDHPGSGFSLCTEQLQIILRFDEDGRWMAAPCAHSSDERGAGSTDIMISSKLYRKYFETTGLGTIQRCCCREDAEAGRYGDATQSRQPEPSRTAI
jgi:hypothetical protein